MGIDMYARRPYKDDKSASALPEPYEELPGVHWKKSVYLVLEMVKPFRPKKPPADIFDWLDDPSCDEIPHEAFVKAHESLPFQLDYYRAAIVERNGKPSEELPDFETSLTSYFYHRDIFDYARDFVRTCALEGFEATYDW